MRSSVQLADRHPGRRLLIPWLTSSLVADIRLYFLAQPVLWLLGLEQLAPAALAPWMLLKRLVGSTRIRIPRAAWPALLLLGWQMLHFLTIPRGEIDLLLKAVGTLLAVVCLSIAIYNAADTLHKWERIIAGIELFGAISVLLGFLFIVGVWSSDFRSAVGSALPERLTSGSHFFSSIVTRNLGFRETVLGYRRVRSTFWHPSSYASVLMAFFAVQWFQLRRSRGQVFGLRLLSVGMVLLNLAFTLSRTTYVAFLAMLAVLWWLTGRTSRSRLQKVISLGLLLILILAYTLLALLVQADMSFDAIYDLVYEFRPFSLQVRTQIYETSWELIKHRPWWGWGTTVEIESLPSYFSAGSHSDYLSVLFQYGIPGLLLYLGFLGNIWYVLLKGYHAARDAQARSFFGISIAFMLGMNLRQFTSGLLWDVYVASMIWGVWALALALYALERGTERGYGPPDRKPPLCKQVNKAR